MTLADVKRILVINVTRIGDTLLATPAIRAIAHAFPEADLTCLGHPKRIEILANLPFIRHIAPITKRRALWMGRLGGKRYDLAFVYGFDKPLVQYALRVARKVVAFQQNDPDLDSRLYRAVALPPFQSMHAVEQQLALPAALGIPPAGLHLSYQVNTEEQEWARDRLRKSCPEDAWPLIGLQVASFPTKAYRDWPIEHFIHLCERIIERYPHTHFLVFGGGGEKKRIQMLHRCLLEHATIFAGRLTLRETAALMARMNLYIGVDTGPTHIMGSLHRPLIVLYHPTGPSRLLAPFGHPCFYPIDHPLADKKASFDTPMSDIPVDAVLEKVQTVLGSPKSIREPHHVTHHEPEI